jgi:hypothetical protein
VGSSTDLLGGLLLIPRGGFGSRNGALSSASPSSSPPYCPGRTCFLRTFLVRLVVLGWLLALVRLVRLVVGAGWHSSGGSVAALRGFGGSSGGGLAVLGLLLATRLLDGSLVARLGFAKD